MKSQRSQSILTSNGSPRAVKAEHESKRRRRIYDSQRKSKLTKERIKGAVVELRIKLSSALSNLATKVAEVAGTKAALEEARGITR